MSVGICVKPACELIATQGDVCLTHAAPKQRDPRLQAYIDKVVADCPPLTPAQRDRLALLLRPEATP